MASRSHPYARQRRDRSQVTAAVGLGSLLAAGLLLAPAPAASASAMDPGPAPATSRLTTAPAVAQPVQGELSSVAALSRTDAWAVGATQTRAVLVEHWDGASWRQVRAPSPGYVNQLSSVSGSAPDDVWAVGSQFYSGKTEYYDTLAEHYDGARWSVVPSPSLGASSHLTGVRVLAADNVWAVGWVEEHGSGDRTLIEHYDGATWSVVLSPNPTSGPASAYSVETLYGVWGSGPSDVWAVGSYYPKSNNYFEAPLTLHWDGQHWRQVPSPSNPDGAPESYLDAVSGVSASNATAVGAVYVNGWRGLIEHWNGSSWQVVTSPDPIGSGDTQLFATSAFGPHDAWAVGEDVSADSGVTERLAPQGWRLVGVNNEGSSGLSGVSADDANDAWAVGTAAYGEDVFTVIDHWDGSSWTELTSLP